MLNFIKKKSPHLFIGFYVFMAVLLICFSAMPNLMLQASKNIDFVHSNAGSGAPAVSVGAGAVNLLVMDLTIPDGTNGGAADSLVYDKGSFDYNGEPLISMAANEYYLDNNYNATLNPTESVWGDVNTNGLIEGGEIAAAGTADLETFNNEWGFDGPATDNGNYDAGEALYRDVNGDSYLGFGDTLIKDGLAKTTNFNTWALAHPGICGGLASSGGCHNFAGLRDIYWCDGPDGSPAGKLNGVYDSGEAIYADYLGSVTIDYEAPSQDVLISDPNGYLAMPAPGGRCALAGTIYNGVPGVPMSLTTAANPVAHPLPQPVVFLDYESFGLYSQYGRLGPGLKSNGEPIVWLVAPIPDGAPLQIANFVAFAPAAFGVSSIAPNWHPAYVSNYPMAGASGGNLRFIGTTSATDTYTGWEAIVDDSLGGGLGVLANADFLIGDTVARVPGPGKLNQPFPIVYAHGGTGTYDSSENIYDESTGANPNLLDWAPDVLEAITLTNAGTAVNATDIAAVKVWAEGVIGGWGGGADETLLGTATWDGNSWVLDLSATPEPINLGGLRLFVTVNLSAAPTHGRTIQMQIPLLADAGSVGSFQVGDEGVFVASNNDGPTDAAVVNPNVQTINTTNPNLISISATDYIISEADAGGSWTVTLVFDKQMAPTLAGFTGTTAPDDIITSTALSALTGWGWSAGDTQLNLTYNIQDGNEELLATTMSLSGLADIAANPMNPFNGTIPIWPANQNIVVDTVGPSTTGIAPATGSIGVTANASVVINFNDAMTPGSLTYTSVPNPGSWGESWDTTKKIVTLTHSNFTPSISYTFTLIGANDDVGNWLIAGPNDTTNFTTGVFPIGGGGGGMTIPNQGEPGYQPAPEEGEAAPDLTLPAGIELGMAVRLADSKTVYLIGVDKKRHPFPNEKTYFSWFADFSQVNVVSSATMAAIPMGANVVVREGTYLIKITTVDKVYAVEPDGVIRWIESEALAKQLYGKNWPQRVVDIADAFFTDYSEGSAVTSAVHPTGALIQYSGEADIYFIDKGMKRQVSTDVFESNLYQDKFIITGVSASISYINGGLMMPLALKDILPM